MNSNNGGDNDSAGGGGDDAKRAAQEGVAEEADSGAGAAEVELDVAFEVGEAVAEVVEAGEGEGVVLGVELEEEIVGGVALGLGERRRRVEDDGEEVEEGRVEAAREGDGVVEAEAEVGGGFAVLEVGGDEAREVAFRFGFCEGFADAV